MASQLPPARVRAISKINQDRSLFQIQGAKTTHAYLVKLNFAEWLLNKLPIEEKMFGNGVHENELLTGGIVVICPREVVFIVFHQACLFSRTSSLTLLMHEMAFLKIRISYGRFPITFRPNHSIHYAKYPSMLKVGSLKCSSRPVDTLKRFIGF